MTALEQIEIRMQRLERRLRVFTSARGFAAATVTAFLLTLALAYVANQLRFAGNSILPLRVLLVFGIAAVAAFAIVFPLTRINRKHTAHLAESNLTDLNGRLLTLTERPDPDNPFSELIAEDTLPQLDSPTIERLSPPWLIYSSLGVAIAACILLAWMITAGPGFWGYGASLLWTGVAHTQKGPLYSIAVQPGNHTIRRRSDQLIVARLMGFSDRNVALHAKYRGVTKWDALSMSPQPASDGYQLLFPGLADSLEYYVEAGGIQSRHYTIEVRDLPAVQRLRVEVKYPPALGLPNSVQDPGGDIRAIEGSQAHISVLTDKPLANGTLVLEDGSKVLLTPGQGAWLTASLPIDKDGSYHVAELDAGETVRISDDYFIEARKDEPPAVRIVRPGTDPHVSPIEEVPITVEASDDFGIHSLQLHYSVNGGPEQVKTLAQAGNNKELSSSTTLYFEDFKLQPGDLVSFYATAQDATHTSRSDIVFAQAEPFDFKFRQSQQAGGGGMGGGNDESGQISRRQKEIIAATWNELKSGKPDASAAAADARFLSDLENKLSAQAKTLAERMGSRDLTSTSSEFSQFSTQMTQASTEMASAVDQLKPGKWQDALPPEQKALQNLLRAESLFREIQVAYGQRGGGMGMSGQQRELARLFDLELDKSKNQYETGQSVNQSSDQKTKIDAALEKLKELAQRQQLMAGQQRTPDQQFQQRWEEEQLRREAAQLRQQMQQLAQNSQSQSQSGQQSDQDSSSGQASSSSSGRNSRAGAGGQSQAMREAMQSLERAEDEMGQAASRGDKSAQDRAAQQLTQAQSALGNLLHRQTGNNMSNLAQQARHLAEQQKNLAGQVKSLYGASGVNTADTNSNADGSPLMPEMNGPDFAGGWYRRRMYSAENHPPTSKEKALAQSSDDLARQMDQLQQQLQQQAQSMSATQPESGRELKKALSLAEQQDLALRMQKNAQWLGEGYGSQVWPLEDSITAGVQQLSKNLDNVASGINQANQRNASSPAGGKLQQALSEIRSLREQLESQSAQRAPRESAAGQTGAGGPATATERSGEQTALDQLYSLRSEFGRTDRQFDNTLSYAISSLRRIKSQPGRLDAVLDQDAITNLARVELELIHHLNNAQTGVHTGVPENVPDQYRDALARYYRQLSN